MAAESPIPVTKQVLEAKQQLIGRTRSVTVETSTGGLCGGERVRLEIIQPDANSAWQFNEVATGNVIEMLTAIKSESSYEGFGFEYSASAEGLIDKYGNPSTGEVLWLCYTSQDVSKINLSNEGYLKSNVLNMNTLGQDDVDDTYGR